jgi:hypothetical protein
MSHLLDTNDLNLNPLPCVALSSPAGLTMVSKLGKIESCHASQHSSA